ncbi:MAG: acyltransferase [Carboxydocellales bacterium]
MNQRLKEITYLRAFAALSIILVHASSGYVNTGPLCTLVNQLPRYGTPIFVMMSGFILYHVELIRPSPSYWLFFKHRFLKVAIPYLIWTVIYSTYSMRGYLLNPDSLEAVTIMQTYLFNIVTGRGFVHLYFILVMIQLYALFPFLQKGMERCTYTTLTTVALISFLFQALIYLHSLNVIILPSLGIAYVALFPGWLFFFCLGIYLKTRQKQVKDFWQKRIFFCTLIWLCLAIIVFFDRKQLQIDLGLRPTVTLYGIASFFLFNVIFANLKNYTPKRADQLIEWLANSSFHLYLIHPLALSLLILPYNWPGYYGMAALYVTTVILTLLFIYILDKIKELTKRTA